MMKRPPWILAAALSVACAFAAADARNTRGEREELIKQGKLLQMEIDYLHLRIQHYERTEVTVTGFSSTKRQTDDDPNITAFMQEVGPGMIALSRDLLPVFNPGSVVWIEGFGMFTVLDTMAARHTRAADIWCQTEAEARKIDRHKGVLMTKVEI